MVRAGVVNHPSEWSFGGYNEIAWSDPNDADIDVPHRPHALLQCPGFPLGCMIRHSVDKKCEGDIWTT